MTMDGTKIPIPEEKENENKWVNIEKLKELLTCREILKKLNEHTDAINKIGNKVFNEYYHELTSEESTQHRKAIESLYEKNINDDNLMSYKEYLDKYFKYEIKCESTSISLVDILTEKEIIRRYLQYLADELNGDWKPDWKPDWNYKNMTKFFIYFDNNNNKFKIYSNYNDKKDVIYFKSKDIAKKVIDIASDQLKILHDIKD